MSNFIRLNMLAEVFVQGGEHFPQTRTFVLSDSIHVYKDNPDGGTPVEAYTARIDDFTGSAVEGWEVLTSDGETVTINRLQGCACGSRLKGFNPFPGVPFRRVK